MGRYLILEFEGESEPVFDEIMQIVHRHPQFEHFQVREQSSLTIDGFAINLALKIFITKTR